MAKPETTACWYKPYSGSRKDKWSAGCFHQWGSELASVEGEGNFTIGVIQDSHTGAVVTVIPERVHFGVDPDALPRSQ